MGKELFWIGLFVVEKLGVKIRKTRLKYAKLTSSSTQMGEKGLATLLSGDVIMEERGACRSWPTFSGSDDWFLQLTRSYSATCTWSSQLHCLQRWHAVQEETLFISFSKDVAGIRRDCMCLEKDTNKCSCLICDSSCCRTSFVGVQPYTSRDLPNTETLLPSHVFCVRCVVPTLCQIMYSLSVCSDGTTEAQPRSFCQNRPTARTLSLT